ncbi:NAD(P)-dependent oxidoreductase [Ruegeria sp. 2205SS24-7]|uniref:NAD(P)-dependent oxidoreductase n=1 Tax=Ruegeria discodermiae TaxID=3064389 RepID=UPI0027411904|nr:NAD(P)-dependent oxidoreductase [Ruegeria sp. 2205SS24-7]MDP5218003.1 NAD(P)-dependent oxidoreductase [Ruegeria sp. 2205SS24-7]
MQSELKVAVLGTGLMGFPMARNLCSGGFDIAVWNRSADKAAPLAGFGARVAATAADAVAGAHVVISMLSDGAAVLDLAGQEDLRAALGQGATWIDMSSTKPQEARALATSLQQIGVQVLDAPVSGGTRGAEQASLAIMVGGAPEVLEHARPVLQALGRPVHVGPTGSGQLAKLANQTIVAITIGAVAEATLLLEAGGADVAAVRDALKGGFADSTILQQHGARMSARDFAPGGPSHLQVKDLDNALAEAEGLSLVLPTASAIRDRFQRYVSGLDGGERDHSGLYEELLDLNGLKS